jgi:hypothetical protein
MGAAARRITEERFSLARMVEATEDLYHAVATPERGLRRRVKAVAG